MTKRILLVCLGWFCVVPAGARAGIFVPFQGRVDFEQKQFQFVLNPESASPIKMQVSQTSGDLYIVTATVDHLQTPFFDIATILKNTVELVRADNGRIKVLYGQVESQYSLINYKPIDEVFGKYEIRDQTLFIKALSLGNLFCKGSVQLVAPHRLDLWIQLTAVDLEFFISFFSRSKKIPAQGTVDGDIYVTGNLKNIHLKGDLVSYRGKVKAFPFDDIVLHLQGYYPILDATGSNVTQSDGMTFNILGALDLSESENFGAQIKALGKLPVIKATDTGKEWTLKRFRSEEGSSSTEFKYLMRSRHGSKKDPLKEEELDMLGVEQKMEF